MFICVLQFSLFTDKVKSGSDESTTDNQMNKYCFKAGRSGAKKNLHPILGAILLSKAIKRHILQERQSHNEALGSARQGHTTP